MPALHRLPSFFLVPLPVRILRRPLTAPGQIARWAAGNFVLAARGFTGGQTGGHTVSAAAAGDQKLAAACFYQFSARYHRVRPLCVCVCVCVIVL